jgi:hypothetical protein
MQMMTRFRSVLLYGSLLLTVEGLSACGTLNTTHRLVYDQQDIQIGVEADPTISRSNHSVQNNHPADVTANDLESLLRVIEVSGWSGTLVGILDSPRPVPLFTTSQLSAISGYLTAAFQSAKPTERVFFSLPKPEVAYSEDRTAGSLFFRGRYLHVVVTDHSSFIQADTGGGDLRDIRDTKGMKLWVAGPVQAAMVPDLEQPQWAPFEAVHVSLNVKEVWARQAKTPPLRFSREEAPAQSSPPASSLRKSGQTSVSAEELQLQIHELTGSNLELRSRLEEQNKRMQTLNDQLEQLRLELDKSKSKKQLTPKSPSP